MAREASPKISPQVILLGVAAMLNDISSDIIYPLLPIFLTSYIGATPLVTGMIEGVAEAVSSILKYASGFWSDRMARRKPFVISGYFLAGAARAIVAVATQWPLVLVGRLLDKTGKGLRSAPRDAMICDVTPPENRGKAFGLHRAFDNAGAVIGPLMAAAGLGLLHLSLPRIFLFAVVPAAIGVVMLMFLLKEEHRYKAPSSRTEISAAPLGRHFWTSIGSIALFYLSNSSDVFLILQAHASGVSVAMIPVLWSAHHVVKVLFSTKAGALSDRVERTHLLVAGWLVYAVIYFVFPFAGSLPMFLILFVAYSIPFTLTEGAERAWISDLVPQDGRGKSFGVYHMTVGICTLAGTALFGILYQEVSPRAAFHTGAAIALLAALSITVQKRGARGVV
ncbi:MAG: MFS transporter [Acidobacteriota bacterium]